MIHRADLAEACRVYALSVQGATGAARPPEGDEVDRLVEALNLCSECLWKHVSELTAGRSCEYAAGYVNGLLIGVAAGRRDAAELLEEAAA